MDNFLVEALVIALLLLFPTWRIFKRAGLNPGYSLTLLIPILGMLVAGLVLAASKWNFGIESEESQ